MARSEPGAGDTAACTDAAQRAFEHPTPPAWPASRTAAPDLRPDVIRAPNHLGDFILALPALAAVPDATVLIARWLVPLAELLPRSAPVIPFDRGRTGMIGAARTLRRRRFNHGVLLAPSLSAALVFRLGGVRRVRGAATHGRRLLLHDAVPPGRLRDQHRTELYLELVTGSAPTVADGSSGSEAAARPVPQLPLPPRLAQAWREMVGPWEGQVVGIFPGSNAPSRRWAADRFAAVARSLAVAGARVMVFGSPGEAALTRVVAGDVAEDMAGRTDLPVLAAALAACDILVTNDSGPMHLAAAVGTRTLVVSGPADPKETAPGGVGHEYMQRLDLPCVPCVRNECPRRGAGYILPEAERECLRLIQPRDIMDTALRMLQA
jgi:heptosyltransferase II